MIRDSEITAKTPYALHNTFSPSQRKKKIPIINLTVLGTPSKNPGLGFARFSEEEASHFQI